MNQADASPGLQVRELSRCDDACCEYLSMPNCVPDVDDSSQVAHMLRICCISVTMLVPRTNDCDAIGPRGFYCVDALASGTPCLRLFVTSICEL